MLFNSVIFLFAFLPITYAVFWILRTARSRYVWLTITGYVFYGYWDPSFCLLMLFSTLVSYFAGLAFLRWDADPVRRRWCLAAPVVADLALLGFFKYANFGIETASWIAGLFGERPELPALDIVLPVGISFYTFHTISYIVDAYRRVIVPTRNFWEFASYVSLFSQLVAGPIVRFRQIEEDLENIAHHDRRDGIRRGIAYFCVGLVEKVLIADTLAAMVDPALTHWETLGTVGTWVAMLGYSFQLLFDFSGYSTMAVGLGLLFGLRIPQNFNSPYQSKDPSEFWRRWHISLSTCLRDYLYISFGGNRGSELATYRNLMLTMLIGGLWHGASWAFVFWGFYHGLLLAVHRRAGRAWDELPARLRQGGMFLAAVVGWVFFRATSFSMATGILRRMFWPHEGVITFSVAPIAVMVAMGVAAWWSLRGRNVFELDRDGDLPSPVPLGLAFGAALALILSARPSPFLYFQF
jgi:alginate O-acetyltransferase complex protein AlgI